MPPIRSYVRRQGRMVPVQKRALEELWPAYGIGDQGNLDLDALFGRQAPCHLEIGFGMGDALLTMANAYPENNYLGIEVHLPGVGQALLGVQEMKLANVRIDRRDAMEVLAYLPAASLARVSLFFPDPWHKQRYHKRRLVQEPFVEKLHQVLAPGGVFHAATDSEHYARQMVRVLDGAEGFVNLAAPGTFHPRPQERPQTKFAHRSLLQGQEVRDLLYSRT